LPLERCSLSVRPDSAGNNNGYVCARPRPDSVRDAFCKQGGVGACNLAGLGLPIYLVFDDDNQAMDNVGSQ
jgi:hypothetical protein